MDTALFNKEYITAIAKVCHQAIKVFCETHGDYSIKNWEDAEEWQKESTMTAVAYRINNPGAGYDSQHLFWIQEKIDKGWTYGETKDGKSKTHPGIIPYDQLSDFEKKKDALFCAVVDALK